MNKKFDLVVAGYPSMDRIIKVKDNPRFGITSLIENSDNSKINYGGCSINIAYLGARLSMNTLPILRVGEDFESTGFKSFLKKGGVCLDGIIKIEKDMTSNCYLIENADGSHITLFYPGAMDSKYYFGTNSELISKAKYAVITVGCLEENWDFMRQAKNLKIPIVTGMKCDFSAFPYDFLKELLYSSNIIFANDGEKIEIEKQLNLSHISELLMNGEASVIAITKGCDGSEVYFSENGEIKKKSVGIAKPRKVVDTTGVGDAYMTGFLYALIKDKNYEECAAYGAVASSFIIEEMGCLTSIPTIEEFEQRYRECYL